MTICTSTNYSITHISQSAYKNI